jgi:hypothetical protein
MRNKELKVTQEFTNLFNDKLVIYKNILVKGRSKITFYNYIIVTRKGIFAITTKTTLGRMVTDKYKVKWKSYIGFIPFIFTNPPLDVSYKSCDLDFVSDCEMDKIIPISIIKNKGKNNFYIDMDYTQKEKFYYELYHQEDVFSDKEVAQICELIEKKALVFSRV